MPLSPRAGRRQPELPIGFAHRGARSERRENTIEAFSRALELGATGLETDAWITADGTVVLDHDGVLGPWWHRRSFRDVVRADLPAHVPTLEELYARCGCDFELSIDIKDPAALAPLVDEARAAGASTRLWLCRENWLADADRWRHALPEVRLVESADPGRIGEGLAARAEALAGAGVDALNLRRRHWNRSSLGQVHSAGLLAFGWDAQSRSALAGLLDLGVDALYSDHVDRMMDAIRRQTSRAW